MIKDKDIAKYFLNKQFEISELMNSNLAELKDKLSPEEFNSTRKATAYMMAEILFRGIEPILQEHPDLSPPELAAHYNPQPAE
ncbi:hypothetical protein [Klebsiella sp. BIGb0407]|uniref:hypothetical protein n=1 Tax=Klebsiella sp. BIGb0407 TaxID=2940603 RepID=UPI0021688A56|nr:hypothetical protein [Klebsiella sp. BIGb0407]MCS3433960.1 hypothetical protein [Klebsiella sp. BIGb0407]